MVVASGDEYASKYGSVSLQMDTSEGVGNIYSGDSTGCGGDYAGTSVCASVSTESPYSVAGCASNDSVLSELYCVAGGCTYVGDNAECSGSVGIAGVDEGDDSTPTYS